MARTGSGKTAAFLLPLFEHLKTHSTKVRVCVCGGGGGGGGGLWCACVSRQYMCYHIYLNRLHELCSLRAFKPHLVCAAKGVHLV